MREVFKQVTLQPAKRKYGKMRRRNDASISRDPSLYDGNDSDDSQYARFKIVTENEKIKMKFS